MSSWPPSPVPRVGGPSTPGSRHRQYGSASGSHFPRLPIPKDSRSPFSGVETGMVGPERLEEESGFCLCSRPLQVLGKYLKSAGGGGWMNPGGRWIPSGGLKGGHPSGLPSLLSEDLMFDYHSFTTSLPEPIAFLTSLTGLPPLRGLVAGRRWRAQMSPPPHTPAPGLGPSSYLPWAQLCWALAPVT